MVNYSLEDEVVYKVRLAELGISKYKPLTLIKKVCGYTLIGYGLVTFILPSGSQVALLVGCGMLGIPFSKVWGKIKHYANRVWFVVCVVCNKKRLGYECRRLLL